MFAIRPATPLDAPGIARVHVDSWRTTYAGIVPQDYLDSLTHERREQYWQKALGNPNNRSFVYVAQSSAGEIVGFACAGPAQPDNEAYMGELYAIYILKDRQGKGIGRSLFNAVVERLAQTGVNSMLLWVLAGNPVCGFYEAMGGRKVDEKQVQMGGATLTELAYAWDDTGTITARAQQ